MKILFLATRDWYHPETTGGDITLWETARYLASVGHEVTFVSARYRGAPKAGSLDGINLVRLGGIHSLWFRTFVYYMTRARGKFDVVVAEGFGGSRIPRLAPLYVAEPMVTEWHQIHRDLFAIQYPKLLNGPLNLLERLTARVHRDTLVRAGTEEWRRAFPSIGFKPENIFLLPVSIREDWLAELPGGRGEEPTILWIVKLRRYKCADHAIRALPAVLKAVPQARLIMAVRRDDQKYERELRDLARELQIEGNIEFRINIDESDKRDLFHAVRVLVLPSAVEGFGIVVLEANACGVPVVASSGVPEGAVRHEGNGLRYPFGHIDDLSTALIQVLTDERLHARLAADGRAFAKQFGWTAVSSRYEEILKRIAIDKQRGPIAHREANP